MTLVDTSVWVDHLRGGDTQLARLLHEGEVLCHPLVIEELALGRLPRREEILELLSILPKATQASHEEFMEFVKRRRPQGQGIGAIDAHLMISALLSRAKLWTRDKRLDRAAAKIGIQTQ